MQVQNGVGEPANKNSSIYVRAKWPAFSRKLGQLCTVQEYNLFEYATPRWGEVPNYLDVERRSLKILDVPDDMVDKLSVKHNFAMKRELKLSDYF